MRKWKRWSSLPLCLLFLFASGSREARSGEINYSRDFQSEMESMLVEMASARLPLVLWRYNGQRKDWGQRYAIFNVNGVSMAEAKRYFARNSKTPLLPATMEDGSIVIKYGRHRIELGPTQYLQRSILVDGIEFRWDPQKSFSENERYLSTYFVGWQEHASAWNPFALLLREAVANDVFEVTSNAPGFSMIHLLFDMQYDSGKDKGAELVSLTEQMELEQGGCESTHPELRKVTNQEDSGKLANWLDSAMNTMRKTSPKNNRIQLRSCADIEKFADSYKGPSALQVPVDFKHPKGPSYKPSPSAVARSKPLCELLSTLQQCIEAKANEVKESSAWTFLKSNPSVAGQGSSSTPTSTKGSGGRSTGLPAQ